MAIRFPASLAKSSQTKALTTKVLKNAGTVAAAMTLGDFGCQAMESWGHAGVFSWDRARTMRMAFTGVFVTTPMSYAWNLCAERVAPGTSWNAVAKKLVVQVVAMPPMLAAQFASLTLLEEGKTMGDARRRIAEDMVPTLEVCICYWPAVGILCSRFVSVMNRPGVISIAGVFWNMYLSHQANHNGLQLGEVTSVASTPDLRALDGTSATNETHESTVVVKSTSDATRRDVPDPSNTASPKSDASSTEARAANERVGEGDRPRSRKLKRKLVRSPTYVSM